MKESLDDAIIELKRADHLIYVSLKYTRTVDVFRHIIERMINFFELITDVLIKKANKEKKLEGTEKNIGLRSEELKKIYAKDEKIVEILDFYIFLRKLLRSKYTKENEFRRPVKMTAIVDNQTVEVTIDEIHIYYDRCKEYLEYIKTLIE